jgi:hypothetical protein
MSLLVTWFKVAALDQQVDDETYVAVARYIPAIFDMYNELLDQA